MILNFDWIVSNVSDRESVILLNGKSIKYSNIIVEWLEDEGDLDYNGYGEKIYFLSIDETAFKKIFNKTYTEFI